MVFGDYELVLRVYRESLCILGYLMNRYWDHFDSFDLKVIVNKLAVGYNVLEVIFLGFVMVKF